MKKVISIGLFLSMFFLQKAYPTHIVGGEINYTYLGSDNYLIDLTVYRDCGINNATYDNPASLGIFNSSGSLVTSCTGCNSNGVMIPLGTVDPVPSNVSDPCLVAPNNICYEVTTYQTTVTLPPILGGYQLVYQRCCRNHSIQNIVNPGATSASYYATIPGPPYSGNSNPVFTELPPIYICNQLPFSFDHSAVDPDGDSLVYELYTPWDDNTAGVSAPAQPSPPGAPVNSNPPYPEITWETSYSLGNMMGGVPLAIDPQTGLLTATPNTLGQFVFGIRVKEYRDGVYLGSTQRDFQANVEACPLIPVIAQPSAPPDVITCDPPYVVDFTSTGTYPQYFWDFGDGNSSTIPNPTHTYSDTGTYQVMFVAIDITTCNGSDTAYLTVNVIEKEDFSASLNVPPLDPCVDSMLVNLEFTGTGADSIVWNMGNGTVFIDDTVINYYYTVPGTYIITMTAYDLLCNNVGTITQTVEFNPLFSYAQAVPPPDIITCEPPYNVSFTSTGSSPNYFWDFGDGNSASTQNPTHTYADTGTYQVMFVVIDSTTCNVSDTSYFTVTLLEKEELSAVINVPTYDPCVNSLTVNLTFTGTGADSIVWDMGDGTVFVNDTIVNYNYTIPGSYVISMTAYDTLCNNIETISETVFFSPDYSYAQANAPPNVFSCEPPYEVDFTTTGNPPPPNVFWDFGDGIGTSTLANITYTYADTGTYQVMYVSIDSTTCNIADTAYFTVGFELAEEFNATFDIPVLPACRTSDSLWVNLNFTGSAADSIVWDMGDGTVFVNDTLINYLYLYPGNYLISMTAYDLKCNNVGTITELVQFAGTYDDVFVPNAFTPNGDGNNDILFVRGLGITEVYFILYNRWGEKIFETNNQEIGWDGTYEGMLVDPATYAYYLNITFCDGEKYFEKGNVTLLK